MCQEQARCQMYKERNTDLCFEGGQEGGCSKGRNGSDSSRRGTGTSWSVWRCWAGIMMNPESASLIQSFGVFILPLPGKVLLSLNDQDTSESRHWAAAESKENSQTPAASRPHRGFCVNHCHRDTWMSRRHTEAADPAWLTCGYF